MIDNWQLVLTVIAAVAAAISAGAFFAFSNFVMRGLSTLPTAQGISAMQAINKYAPNPTFVVAIVGAGLFGVPVAVAEWDNLDTSEARFLLAAVLLSVASFVITMTLNVPRNTALDRHDPNTRAAEDYWQNYLTTWTRANTARCLTSSASVAAYALWLA